MRKLISNVLKKTRLLATVSVVLLNALLGTLAYSQPASAFLTNDSPDTTPAETQPMHCPAGYKPNATNTKCVVVTSQTNVSNPTAPKTTSNTTLACVHQPTAQATNVIWNGLSGGSDVSALIKSFQNYYNAGGDGHNTADLKTVYNYGGASQTMVNNMSTANTFLGYSHNDGTVHVVINGVDTVVGTNMLIAARWGESDTQNFTQIPGTAVCMHSYTRWFSNGRGTGPDVPTLVHIDQTTGIADFATWRDCGNMITFTKVPPKKTLECTGLTSNLDSQKDSEFNYSFTVTATAKNVTITSYTFDFGNGSVKTFQVQNLSSFKTTQTYNQTDSEKTFTIKARVNDQDFGTKCMTTIKITPKPPLKSLACVVLNETHTGRVYTFTATAQVNNTTINSYVFDFGDGSAKVVVNSNALTVSAPAHTYADSVTSATASFSASGPDGVTPASDACTKPISFTLVRTGPGDTLGLVALTSTLGIGFHQLVLRKRLA